MADKVFLLTKSPCTIKEMIDIKFEENGVKRSDARKSVWFQDYFDRIWRSMQYENKDEQ
jgi:ABC-type nitrate/sulfonate/bicarbonate transport system ATPase subunit